MTAPAEQPPLSPTLPARRGAALEALPARQAAWTGAQAVTAGLLALGGLWSTDPHLALAVSLGTGAAAANPRRLWALPLLIAAAVGGGALFDAMRWPAVLGAGAAVGVMTAWLLPHQTDAVDLLHGALGTATAASLGLWAALSLLPDPSSGLTGATLSNALVGLVASQGLLPLALRFDADRLPSRRAIRKALLAPYRPPVLRALELFVRGRVLAPDRETAGGLAEVVSWVFRLQVTRQTLDVEIAAIDPDAVEARIAECDGGQGQDSFTRERRQATASHLRRLLEHRHGLTREAERTAAMVDYALAFLEEARAGLTLGQQLPGETTPERLPEVLGRLRGHAAAGDARRRTARELA